MPGRHLTTGTRPTGARGTAGTDGTGPTAGECVRAMVSLTESARPGYGSWTEIPEWGKEGIGSSGSADAHEP